MRVVALDEACRVQQVHDGAFAKLADVPTQAFTLTVPVLMAAHEVFVMVPGAAKARAVAAAAQGPVTNECPASILRKYPMTTLYLDEAAASLLEAQGNWK